MESRNYWHCFGTRFDVWARKMRDDQRWRLACRLGAGGDQGKTDLGGRGRSLEVYLSVPTFIRRGIRPLV